MINIEQLIKESVKELDDKYNLPQEGILAGGSLCSMVLGKIRNEEYPINDIDIFIKKDKEDLDKLSTFEISIKTPDKKYTIGEAPNYFNNPSKEIKINNKKIQYNIISHRREDIFNYIDIFFTSDCPLEHNEEPISLIRGFDINAVQLAYDLETQKTYWTSDFEEFTRTQILRISHSNNRIFNTLIRLSKKSRELKCDIDPIDIEIIDYFISINNNNKWERELLNKIMDVNVTKFKNDSELDKKYIIKNSMEKLHGSIPLYRIELKNNNTSRLYELITNACNKLRESDIHSIYNYIPSDFSDYDVNIFRKIIKNVLYNSEDIRKYIIFANNIFRNENFIDGIEHIKFEDLIVNNRYKSINVLSNFIKILSVRELYNIVLRMEKITIKNKDSHDYIKAYLYIAMNNFNVSEERSFDKHRLRKELIETLENHLPPDDENLNLMYRVCLESFMEKNRAY